MGEDHQSAADTALPCLPEDPPHLDPGAAAASAAGCVLVRTVSVVGVSFQPGGGSPMLSKALLTGLYCCPAAAADIRSVRGLKNLAPAQHNSSSSRKR
jgi:hypothetical protein